MSGIAAECIIALRHVVSHGGVQYVFGAGERDLRGCRESPGCDATWRVLPARAIQHSLDFLRTDNKKGGGTS